MITDQQRTMDANDPIRKRIVINLDSPGGGAGGYAPRGGQVYQSSRKTRRWPKVLAILLVLFFVGGGWWLSLLASLSNYSCLLSRFDYRRCATQRYAIVSKAVRRRRDCAEPDRRSEPEGTESLRHRIESGVAKTDRHSGSDVVAAVERYDSRRSGQGN